MEKRNGQIRIADDVLAIIVGLAISDVKGIYPAPQAKAQGGKKNKGGISVHTTEEGEAVVELSLAISYGIKLPVIGAEVQEKVRSAVENMTGLKVKEVNLNIVDLKVEE